MTETLQRKNTSIETSVNSVTTEIIESCLDAKAFDVLVLNVKKLSDIADNFVIVSGRSDRHVQGIVNRVLHDMTEKHVEVQSIEGYDHGHWVILDCGDIVLHVFYEPERETYDLEGLWSRAPRLAVERHSQSGAVELRAA